MASFADAILGDILISEPKRREAQTMDILKALFILHVFGFV